MLFPILENPHHRFFSFGLWDLIVILKGAVLEEVVRERTRFMYIGWGGKLGSLHRCGDTLYLVNYKDMNLCLGSVDGSVCVGRGLGGFSRLWEIFFSRGFLTVYIPGERKGNEHLICLWLFSTK